MPSFSHRKTLLSGLAALTLAAAGCGGEEESDSESAATPTPTEQSPPPTATAEESAESPAAPEAGAKKLTPEQAKALLAQNNEAALGEGGHVQIAENLRGVAEPLGQGACKKALLGLAAAEEQFGKALDAEKPLPLRQKLGQKVLALGGKRDKACY